MGRGAGSACWISGRGGSEVKLKVIPAAHDQLTGCRVVDADTGEELEELVSVCYIHRAGHLPRVIIEVYPKNVRIEGEMVGEGTGVVVLPRADDEEKKS